MSRMRMPISLAVALLCAASVALPQSNLFLFPNTSASNGSITGFRSDPFSSLTAFPAQPGAYTLLTNPAGTRYYVVSRSGAETLRILDAANPSTVLRAQNLSSGEGAAITPDGRRVLVLTATGLAIFDTASDNLLTTVDVGNQPTDVALSPDGTRAYVLSPSVNRLTAVDLTTNAISGSPLTVSGQPTSVNVGLNGRVYVTATNRIQVIEGTRMQLITDIALNARPGKMAFTPDGRFALTGNQTPVTGSSVVLVNLVDNTTQSIPNFGNNVVIDQIITAGNSRAYALASASQSLYEISISPLNINVPQFANIGNINQASALVASNEFPSPRFIFVQSGTSLIRLNNTSFPPLGDGQTAIPANTGPLVFSSPAVSGGTPAQVYAFNATQSAAAGTNYLPLIVRVTDAQGRLLQGVQVTFTSDNAGAQIQGATTTTNALGVAQAIVTAPLTPGTFQVRATAGIGAGAPSEVFTLSTGSTGGGGTVASALTIFGGNGQILSESFPITEPLAVRLVNAAGQPVSGQVITFSLTQGSGTLSVNAQNGNVDSSANCSGNQCTATTNADGVAAIGFISTAVPGGFSYSQQTVTATNGTATVNFIITTVIRQQSNGNIAAPPLVIREKPADFENLLVGRAGTTIAEAIRIRLVVQSGAQSGQPIPNVALKVTTPSVNGVPVGPTAVCDGEGGVALTDATGVATCNLRLGGRTGTVPLDITVGGFTGLGGGVISLQVNPGNPGQVRIIQGNNQTGLPGANLPQAFVAEISDGFGNNLPGVPVTWAVSTPNSLTLQNIISVSDSNGRVSALGRLGTVAGQNRATVTINGTSLGAAFNFTVNIQITNLDQISGDGQVANVGASFGQPLVVRVRDERGQPVAGQQVAFAVASGTATLSAATATTNANGQASVTVIAGATAGPVSVRASLNNLTTTFNLTVRTPGPVFSANQITNSAGNQTGFLSPCGIYTIFGSGIATGLNGTVVANPFGFGQLPLQLRNVVVQVGDFFAPIYAVSNQSGTESVIIQAPCELTPGRNVSVVLQVSGGSTTITGVPVLSAQPGIFEAQGSTGQARYASALRPNGTYVSPSNPAVRGERIRVYMTGLGQTNPGLTTNQPGVADMRLLNTTLIAGLSNEGITLVSAEPAAGLIGVYVVTIEIPANAPVGSAIPLNFGIDVGLGSPVYSNNSTLAVAAQ